MQQKSEKESMILNMSRLFILQNKNAEKIVKKNCPIKKRVNFFCFEFVDFFKTHFNFFKIFLFFKITFSTKIRRYNREIINSNTRKIVERDV